MRAPSLPLALLLACGPLAAGPDDASTGTATSSTDINTTEPATATSTPAPDPHTTAGPTSAAPTDTSDFIIEPDNPGPACDPFAQSCPRGQKCVPYAPDDDGAFNATRCVDIMGDAAPGEPCTYLGSALDAIDDCALGSICWDVDLDHHGRCVAQCLGDIATPTCPPAHHCNVASEAALALCVPWCDPLRQACPDEQACVPLGTGFSCAFEPDDPAPLNAACNDPYACASGLLCRTPAAVSAACDPRAPGCCTPFCELQGAPCPEPDQQCLPWFDPNSDIPPGYESVGICAIPE